MTKRNWILLVTSLLAASLLGCGTRTNDSSTGAGKESISAPAAIPIDPATVGGIAGSVSFVGAKPAPQRINMEQDPTCEHKNPGPVFAEDGRVNDNGTLAGAFVYVKAGAEKYAFAPPATPAVLDQNGCMYKPHVLGIMTGQVLQIISSDDTTHNIHPMPQNNREWNMSQTPGAAPLLQKFMHPEIMIPIKCNQHNWMKAWLGVSSNPFFAVTGSDGTFTLQGLPPGDYTIAAWTATFGTQEQKVSIGAKESKSVNFVFKPI